MPVHREHLDVPVRGVRAMWWSSDTMHTAMKESYVVARVVRGQSAWWTAGRLWQSAPGSVLLKQPGDVHREVAREGEARILVISLAPSLVEREGRSVRVHPLPDERGVFLRLLEAVVAGEDRLALEVAVTEVVAALRWQTCVDEHSSGVRRAIEFLRANLDASVSIDDLAGAANLNTFSLCRAFRREVGLPPHAYLTQLRVLRAKELLRTGTRPSDVAPLVGLYDQSQLNRHFRRLVGTTPGRWQRERGYSKELRATSS